MLTKYSIVLAIDALLGFPAAFSDLLAKHAIPAVDPNAGEIENRLAYRDTDRRIHEIFNRKPLSASFDKRGNNTSVAMVHLNRLRERGLIRVRPFDEPKNGIPTAIEVYPAVVKGRKRPGTEALAHCNDVMHALLPDDVQRGTDECDACLCALLALAYGHAGTTPSLPALEGPPSGDAFAREGWIYYPRKDSTWHWR